MGVSPPCRTTKPRPGDEAAGYVLIDTETARPVLGWRGGFLRHSDRRFGLIDMPAVGGQVAWTGDEAPFDIPAELTDGAVRYEALTLDGDAVTLHFFAVDDGERVRFVADAAGFRYETGDEVRSADPAPRWGGPLITAGTLGTPLPQSAGAFAVDDVALPFDNPWGALLYLAGLAFAPDGTAYVAAAHGDVWQVKGLGGDLERVEWRRFATGLYQPLGLAVRTEADGTPGIFVLGRDRITKLIDVNGDGEADRYENFCDKLQILGTPHAYAMGLETDEAGNFYFLKSGSADTDHGGTLLKVAADGSRIDVVATGFRHPNGIGVAPPGSALAGFVTAADNEGNWIPATPLHVVSIPPAPPRSRPTRATTPASSPTARRPDAQSAVFDRAGDLAAAGGGHQRRRSGRGSRPARGAPPWGPLAGAHAAPCRTGAARRTSC